ncbi:peptidoglycan glycosyltransferase [Lachnospiraceae bacterium MD1]|uniref:Peptidoglycan glycosyltransferase n=1 Tax=Variimorphobacter saccharofermentans TaxID=2755051 RepID=A0A839JZU1_9FIRM|nr:penicillin-binding transpeptidase domain-containing protein [Variimorphobacter saccharofermentans]MBB2182707.1 peptidoglycan glycosyltransferase [Variimorphobacter saccharofermentans]
MEKSTGKITKKFNSRMQARLLLVFCVVTLLLMGLMGRLIYIMQVDGERYAKHVLSRQSYVSAVLPYKRGDILDRNGTVLARSELRYRLILDPSRLILNEESIDPTLKAIEKYFGIETAIVKDILDNKPNSQYTIVTKNLKYDEVSQFEAFMEENSEIMGVWFEEEYVRTYPNNTLACDIIGFTSADNIGFWGIEEYYNNELNGTNGREYGYYDSSLNIERIVKKAVNGNSIISTVDSNVQRIIQKHIREFNEEFGSKGIGVVVMNPNNGEILAMASNAEYDLNNPRDLTPFYTENEIEGMSKEEITSALNSIWKNDIISSSFEPGSTFKPITIAAALDENLATNNSTYDCDGVEKVGDRDIHCSNRYGHGTLTLEEALMKSCNDALMQIVMKEGRDIFYQYETNFGIGSKTGVDLPGEGQGIIFEKEKLNATELATSSFGQGISTTMLQLASAYSSMVNGGYYYRPHVMKQIVNDNGAIVREYDKLLVRQTVSEKTSELMQKYLYRTVEEGTAKGAKVEGYAIAGKTGTAQKPPYKNKKYIVSFLGHVPAINPEIVIYVMIDEPQNVEKQADSSIATKFASRILKEILPALGIFPEGEIDYLLEEDVTEEGSTNETTPLEENIQNDESTSTKPPVNNGNVTNNENDPNTDTTGEEAPSADDKPKNEGDEGGTADTVGDSEDRNDISEDDENDDNIENIDTQDENGGLTDGESSPDEDEFNPDALE